MSPNNQKINDESSSSSWAEEEESQNSSASTEEDSTDSKQEPDSIANRKHNQSTTQRNESESNEENNEDFEDEDDEKGSPSFSDSPIKSRTFKNSKVKNTNTASKRSLEFQNGDSKESTSHKKVKTGEENEKGVGFTAVYDDGRNAVIRVWSWADEIALLERAIDYINQTGFDPFANMSDFYEFVKGDLFPGVSRNHVYVKLRRFKASFFRLQGTWENGGDPVFSNPFQYKAFGLSKEIWGGGIQSYGETFLAKYPNLKGSFDMEVGFLKDHVHLIGHTKAKNLERKWTKLQIQEMEVETKKLSLMAGQIKLVLDAMKKG